MAQVTWGKALIAKVTFRNKSVKNGIPIAYTWKVWGQWYALESIFVSPKPVSNPMEYSGLIGANELVQVILIWPEGFTIYPGAKADLYVRLYDQNGKEYVTPGVENVDVVGSPTIAAKFELVSIEVL